MLSQVLCFSLVGQKWIAKEDPKESVREQCMRNMWRISYSQREETGVKISWAGKVIEIVLQSFELNLLLTRKKGTGVPLIETE